MWHILLLRGDSHLFNKETLLNTNPSLMRKPFTTPLHLLSCNFKMNLVTHCKHTQGCAARMLLGACARTFGKCFPKQQTCCVANKNIFQNRTRKILALKCKGFGSLSDNKTGHILVGFFCFFYKTDHSRHGEGQITMFFFLQ